MQQPSRESFPVSSSDSSLDDFRPRCAVSPCPLSGAAPRWPSARVATPQHVASTAAKAARQRRRRKRRSPRATFAPDGRGTHARARRYFARGCAPARAKAVEWALCTWKVGPRSAFVLAWMVASRSSIRSFSALTCLSPKKPEAIGSCGCGYSTEESRNSVGRRILVPQYAQLPSSPFFALHLHTLHTAQNTPRAESCEF